MGSMSGSPGEKTSTKRKRDASLEEMVVLLKNAALDPCDELHGFNQKWKARVLETRKAIFLRLDDVSSFDLKEFPYWKKLKKMHNFSSSIDGRPKLGTPMRRSTRTVLNLGDDIYRKRVPVGTSFQIEVPDWTGEPEYDDNNSKFLGTVLWANENSESQISNEAYVKPRSYPCNCSTPRSEKCIKVHVSMARHHLKSNLGSAFYEMGFPDMGEDVSKSWTQQEQIKFDEIVKENSILEGKEFMEPALEHFTKKTRRDIVSFYHNVHTLRVMSFKSRYETVYTSDDECLGWEKQ